MNELSKLPESPVLHAVTAYLKAATVQVNERCLDGRTPSTTVASSRSRALHPSQRQSQHTGNVRNRNRGGGPNSQHGGGGRSGNHRADQEVEQPGGDLCDRINRNVNLRDHINSSKEDRKLAELEHRREYDRVHGAPRPRSPRTTNIPGIRPFFDRLRAVTWPRNFKLDNVETYDGKANPEQ